MTEKKEISFNEQGFLVWQHFISGRRNKRGSSFSKGKSLTSSTTLHKIIGKYTVNNFVSKMNTGRNAEMYRSFIDLETHKISALVPQVKLFKIKNDKYVPFYFPVSAENTTAASLLQPGASLGGVGIRDFSVSFTGKDFFTRDKQIKCKLSIFVESLENVFSDSKVGFAPLAELFTISRERSGTLREGSSKEVQPEQLNRPSSHEIGAILGYNINRTSSGDNFTSSDKGMGEMFTRRERTAIENASISLRMTYVSHNISVSQDGTSTIDIEYIGRLSGLLNDPLYNVLNSDDDLLRLSEVRKKIDKIGQGKSANEAKSKEKLEKLKSQLKTSTRSKVRNIFELMEVENKVYSLAVDGKSLSEFNFFVGRDIEFIDAPAESPPEDAPQSAVENISAPEANNNIIISYVYMGDFIQATIARLQYALESAIKKIAIGKKSDSQKEAEIDPLASALADLSSFKILFGKVGLVIGDQSTIEVNLADIPVSVKTLGKYMFDEIEQNYVSRLSLRVFMDDIISKIYPMAMENHLYRDARTLPSNVSIKSNHFTAQNLKSLNKTKPEVEISQLPSFMKTQSDKRSKKDESEYFIIYAEMSDQYPVGLKGNAKSDAKEGVYHFNFSKNRGLLKNISFSQNSIKYRKEALMFESVSLYDELKMPYNATITLVGNNLFLPGSLIYINPASLGMGDPRNKRSAAARIGLGGYYRVITVTTTYSEGKLVTQLSTQHSSWADSDQRMSTAEVLQETGVFDKALRIKERNGPKSPVRRLY